MEEGLFLRWIALQRRHVPAGDMKSPARVVAHSTNAAPALPISCTCGHRRDTEPAHPGAPGTNHPPQYGHPVTPGATRSPVESNPRGVYFWLRGIPKPYVKNRSTVWESRTRNVLMLTDLPDHFQLALVQKQPTAFPAEVDLDAALFDLLQIRSTFLATHPVSFFLLGLALLFPLPDPGPSAFSRPAPPRAYRNTPPHPAACSKVGTDSAPLLPSLLPLPGSLHAPLLDYMAVLRCELSRG